MRCSCHSHGSFLTAKGLEEAEQRGVDRAYTLAQLALDGTPVEFYLDKVGSVSALDEDEDLFAFVPESYIEEQHRRFLNGV